MLCYRCKQLFVPKMEQHVDELDPLRPSFEWPIEQFNCAWCGKHLCPTCGRGSKFCSEECENLHAEREEKERRTWVTWVEHEVEVLAPQEQEARRSLDS